MGERVKFDMENSKKIFLLFVHTISLLSVLYCVTGCGGHHDTAYDKGFDDERPDKIKMLFSKTYRQEYRQGQQDGGVYDLGFSDAKNGKEVDSQYVNDPDYMDGYHDGKQ